MIKKKIIIIIFIGLMLFSCQKPMMHLSNNINFDKLLKYDRNLILEIYYRSITSEKFDDYTTVLMIKEDFFDYKVIVNSDMLINNIKSLEQINYIELNEKIKNYEFNVYVRCDFVTKENELIYTFGLGDILEENIVWINNEYYKINNNDLQVFNHIKDIFMPLKYAFPNNSM